MTVSPREVPAAVRFDSLPSVINADTTLMVTAQLSVEGRPVQPNFALGWRAEAPGGVLTVEPVGGAPNRVRIRAGGPGEGRVVVTLPATTALAPREFSARVQVDLRRRTLTAAAWPESILVGHQVLLPVMITDARTGRLDTLAPLRWSSSFNELLRPTPTGSTFDPRRAGEDVIRAAIDSSTRFAAASLERRIRVIEPCGHVIITYKGKDYAGTAADTLPDTLRVGAKVTLTARSESNASQPLPGRAITWSSAATTVAVPDPGSPVWANVVTVHAVGPGGAAIKARCVEDGGDESQITVIVR